MKLALCVGGEKLPIHELMLEQLEKIDLYLTLHRKQIANRSQI